MRTSSMDHFRRESCRSEISDKTFQIQKEKENNWSEMAFNYGNKYGILNDSKFNVNPITNVDDLPHGPGSKGCNSYAHICPLICNREHFASVWLLSKLAYLHILFILELVCTAGRIDQLKNKKTCSKSLISQLH